MKITKDEIEKLRGKADCMELIKEMRCFSEFLIDVEGFCPHCDSTFLVSAYLLSDVSLSVKCSRCDLKFTVHLSKEDTRQISHVTIDKEQNQ